MVVVSVSGGWDVKYVTKLYIIFLDRRPIISSRSGGLTYQISYDHSILYNQLEL